MSILSFNNRVLYLNQNLLNVAGDSPPVDVGVGYWIDSSTGVKTEFGLDSSFVDGTSFNLPPWKNQAREVLIPEGITSVASNALSDSENLEVLNTPSTLQVFSNNMLNNNPKLKSLYINSLLPPSASNLGDGVENLYLLIKVPAESYDLYMSHNTWGAHGNKIFVLNGLQPGSRVHDGYTHVPQQLTYNNANGLVIENLVFDSNTNITNSSYGCITLWGCENVIIRNCKFLNISPAKCISINESLNITVYNCDIIDCMWPIVASQNNGSIRVFSNDVKNIRGFLDGPSSCLFILFRSCTGLNNIVQDNSIENIEGQSSPEDIISTFSSYFDAPYGLTIRNNWLRGGGPSTSGGGIILGDYGGDNMLIEGNTLVNPGQYGIAIAGGANMTMRRNKVYGGPLSWSNVGLIVVDWTPDIPPNGNYTVEYNSTNWVGPEGQPNDYWVWDAQKWPTGWNTNTFQDQSITEDMLPAKMIGVEESEIT